LKVTKTHFISPDRRHTRASLRFMSSVHLWFIALIKADRIRVSSVSGLWKTESVSWQIYEKQQTTQKLNTYSWRHEIYYFWVL